MDIPKEVTAFIVDALGYEAEVTGSTYLDIVMPIPTHYEVELNQ